MAISIFSTRSMIQMLDMMPAANTFLRDTFFRTRTPSEDEFVDIDIRKGKRRVATFVSDAIGSKTVERTGFKVETYKPVLVGNDMITTAADILKRSPNEHIYGAKSPNVRAAEIMARDLVELDNMITRNEEVQCAQALFTGQVQMIGEGVNQTLTFDGFEEVTVDSADEWDQSTSDPEQLLRTMKRKVTQESGHNADIAIFGANALDKFLNNAKMQKKLDLMDMRLASIEPRPLPNGVTYVGRLSSVSLDIYTYDEWYLDSNGTEQPIVPEDKILVGASTAYRSILYGLVVDVEEGSFALPRVPKSWTERKPSARIIQLQSRPLAVPHDIAAHCVATVLT